MMDYETLYDKIYRYCYFKLQHRQDAEDITQEVLLRSLSLEENPEIRHPIRYLYVMARNLCTDRLRKNREEELTEEMPAPELMETVDTGLFLEAALLKLSEDERELVFWRYVSGLSLKDISALTGLSRYAVSRRLNRILKTLREDLKGGED